MNKELDKDTIHLTSSNSLPLYRSINTLAVLSRYVSIKGIDKALLLSGSGIAISDLDNPDAIITTEQELLVIKNLLKLVPDTGLGLIIGNQIHIGIHGQLGMAALSSNTLLDAIEIFFQFSDLLLTYFHYDLTVKDRLAFIKMTELIDLTDMRRFISEREFVSTYRLATDLFGTPFPLIEARIAYPRPKYYSYYKDIYHCPIVFNASDHMFVFDSRYLFKQLPMANPLTRKLYIKECQQISLRLKKQMTMTDRIRQEILFHGDRFHNIDHLARYMNTSSRTIKRYLTVEGTSYRNLLSDIRKNKAINMLHTTNFSIEQIATELGYSDLSNFYRAFKSWTGHTPSSYRRKTITHAH
ncbi:MAG: AraC family transcriptional regulator [Syntrophales bacterium]|jgi:AraC-like DNA-binding protein